MVIDDNSGQTSAELILLVAGVIMIVTIMISIYKDYLFDFSEEINNTELNNLNNKIDNLNNIIKGGE